MTVVGLDHVGVHCTDLERTLAFYHGLLGIPIRQRGVLDGADVAAILGRREVDVAYADLELGAGHTLELLELGADAAGRDALHVALRVRDIHAVHARLTAAGVAVRSAPVVLEEAGFWQGSIAFCAADPDGTTVELIQRPGPEGSARG